MKRQFLINNTDINIFLAKSLSDYQVDRLFNIVLNSGEGATLTVEERFILSVFGIRHINFSKHKEARAYA